MRLAVIVDDYLPSIKSAALMMHHLCSAMAEQGHEVRLFTPSAQIDGVFDIADSEGGYKVVRFASGELKNIGLIKRGINETLLSHRMLKAVDAMNDNWQAHYIVYYSPSIFWGRAVAKLKRRWNCPAYLILRDIFPQWALDGGIFSKYSPIYWYFKFWEHVSYGASDVIAVQTAGNLKHFEAHTSKGKPVIVLQNWFDLKAVLPFGNGLREKYNLQDKVIFFYGGNIGHAQDMMNIIRLAQTLKEHKKAHFMLVGRGDEFDLITAKSREMQLDNVTILPAVPQQEYFEMLSQIDVALFTLHNSHKTQNMPGKLLGYMAYAKPILGSVNPSNDIIDIINSCSAGMVTVNPDDDTFAKNALALLEDDQLRKNMGLNGRKLLENELSSDSIAKQIIDYRSSLTKR